MGAPARDVLGQCSCPVCSSDRASARLSAKGLAYVVCDACNSQVFARSGKSDQLLRDRIKAQSKPADPAPNPVPAADPTPAPQPAPPEPARKSSWSIF